MPNWKKLAAGWVLAVTVALTFSLGAVAQVRNRVIQPTLDIPTTAALAVDSALEGPTSTPSIIRLEPEVVDSATSTTEAPGSTTAEPLVPATIPPAVTSVTTTAQPPGTTTTATTQPPSTTTTTIAQQTQTSSYTLVGGVVTINYSPGVVTFVSAIPQPGYGTDLRETGPNSVRIRFETESHTSDFRAEWEAGELKITQNETGES